MSPKIPRGGDGGSRWPAVYKASKEIEQLKTSNTGNVSTSSLPTFFQNSLSLTEGTVPTPSGAGTSGFTPLNPYAGEFLQKLPNSVTNTCGSVHSIHQPYYSFTTAYPQTENATHTFGSTYPKMATSSATPGMHVPSTPVPWSNQYLPFQAYSYPSSIPLVSSSMPQTISSMHPGPRDFPGVSPNSAPHATTDVRYSESPVINVKSSSLPVFSGQRADWPEFKCVWKSLAES